MNDEKLCSDHYHAHKMKTLKILKAIHFQKPREPSHSNSMETMHFDT